MQPRNLAQGKKMKWNDYIELTEEEHLLELRGMSDFLASQSPADRHNPRVIEEMVRWQSCVSETWALKVLKKELGWKVHKNKNPKKTDLIRDDGLRIEIKFRSGIRIDSKSKSNRGNFFLEKYTHFSDDPKKSQTWLDEPKVYISVFEDGSLWVKKYQEIRQMISSGTLRNNTYCTRHDTYGHLVHWKELLSNKLLAVITGSASPVRF